jgi:hypothetical protein
MEELGRSEEILEIHGHKCTMAIAAARTEATWVRERATSVSYCEHLLLPKRQKLIQVARDLKVWNRQVIICAQ